MKTTKLLIGAISVAAAIAAARADAQNISANMIEISNGLLINGTVDNGSFVQNWNSGVVKFAEFEAFCVDPIEGLSYGESLIYQIQDPNQLATIDSVARLVGAYLESAQTPSIAAAIHWAIWETTTESLHSPSLLDGNVRITTPAGLATADLANQYLANINNFDPVSLVYLTNNGRQDVVTWNIPEPASLMLAAFSSVFLFRRRR